MQSGPLPILKLSSPATRQFWEIAVLFEDEHLIALDKPAGLAVSTDADKPDQPSLTALLHQGIAQAKPWAVRHKLSFLLPGCRVDEEISGVLLFGKSSEAHAALANQFGSEIPKMGFVTIVQGEPPGDTFEIDGKLAPHPMKPGQYHVDANRGKRSLTRCQIKERFIGYTVLRCEPTTVRPHQVRVHLRHAGFRVPGDNLYGGRPLMLSRLKSDYHLKPGKKERPLLSHPALHIEELTLPHPVTGQPLSISAPWPKELAVAVKYLRRWCSSAGVGAQPAGEDAEENLGEVGGS
jgi:RluA family pseudouridine synthase